LARFDWRGEPLLRPTCGPSILDTACFPLVPFSNRIANGRFDADGAEVQISPNMPNSDHPHPLHGFGWLAPWQVTQQDDASATIVHRHPGGEWRWPYLATLGVSLTVDGLNMSLQVRNDGDTPMPAGLGFHPYLPRNALTRYCGLHRGEWSTSEAGLPLTHVERKKAIDWWDGKPVDKRIVDTVYSGRRGDLHIIWPDRRIELRLKPSLILDYTVIYVPKGADYFCVEPVSHMTDAVNSSHRPTGMRWLKPGETLYADMAMAASAF
jgi:aldose 1-epimerase